MSRPASDRLSAFCKMIRQMLTGPQMLAFIPATALLAYWLGGELLLVTTALALPLLIASAGFGPRDDPTSFQHSSRDVFSNDALHALAEQSLAGARRNNRITACGLFSIDGLVHISERFGAESATGVKQVLLDRVRCDLRGSDLCGWTTENQLVVILNPESRANLDTVLSLIRRLQMTIDDPVPHEGTTHFLTAAAGVSLSNNLAIRSGGASLVAGARAALEEAMVNGSTAIRAYSPAHNSIKLNSAPETVDAVSALETGQIIPWFQPQLSTDTGLVSGVEALARWIHPQHGMIPPGDFLAAIEAGGGMERLGEIMVHHSLAALCKWDKLGVIVPGVAVNVSDAELRNPALSDRLKWELDRFDLEPDRLRIEVLETVVTDGPDNICRKNVAALAQHGCRIDLDDFGTGNASIAALQRLNVSCLKIDRAFVTRLDRDENQRRLVAAILSMAERLGVETVAEGVETAEEHNLLSQLGCNHVQGFGIARPMPEDQLADWALSHTALIKKARWPDQNAG